MASRDKSIALEEYEWSNFWWDNRNMTAKTVLLIGDSQTQGIRPHFAQLCPQLRVDMLATSKCADNPDYIREIKYMLEGYKYDVIFFSHGLHGWHLDIKAYENKCNEIIALLAETGARVIVESCLPVALPGDEYILDADRNGIVNERNAVLKKLADERGLKYIDLYGEVIDLADIRSADGMHYTEDGYRILAKRPAEEIRL